MRHLYYQNSTQNSPPQPNIHEQSGSISHGPNQIQFPSIGPISHGPETSSTSNSGTTSRGPDNTPTSIGPSSSSPTAQTQLSS